MVGNRHHDPAASSASFFVVWRQGSRSRPFVRGTDFIGFTLIGARSEPPVENEGADYRQQHQKQTPGKFTPRGNRRLKRVFNWDHDQK